MVFNLPHKLSGENIIPREKEIIWLMLIRKAAACSILLARTLSPTFFSVLSVAAADWKAQSLRWAGGRDPTGMQASAEDYCPWLVSPPVPSNVETGEEPSSLPPLAADRLASEKRANPSHLPYPLRATNKKKYAKTQNDPHQDKPISEHGYAGWVASFCGP